jgi:hypothetical protein
MVTLELKFDGDRVLFDSGSNVGFWSTRLPQLIGTAG